MGMVWHLTFQSTQSMKHIFLFLLSLVAFQATAQTIVDPSEFPTLSSPTMNNWAIYTREDKVNRKVLPTAIRALMLPIVRQPADITYTPAATGNANDKGSFVKNPLGRIYFIDGLGNSIQTNFPYAAATIADNDVHAGVMCVPVGGWYRLSNSNTLGLPPGTLRQRVFGSLTPCTNTPNSISPGQTAVVGGSGVLKVNGDPDTNPYVKAQGQHYESSIAYDTLTHNIYTYNAAGALGSRWDVFQGLSTDTRLDTAYAVSDTLRLVIKDISGDSTLTTINVPIPPTVYTAGYGIGIASNVISNEGVTTINGETGDVTDYVKNPDPIGSVGGDLTGLFQEPYVIGIQGIPVDPTGIADGEALIYDSGTNTFIPGPVGGGGGTGNGVKLVFSGTAPTDTTVVWVNTARERKGAYPMLFYRIGWRDNGQYYDKLAKHISVGLPINIAISGQSNIVGPFPGTRSVDAPGYIGDTISYPKVIAVDYSGNWAKAVGGVWPPIFVSNVDGATHSMVAGKRIVDRTGRTVRLIICGQGGQPIEYWRPGATGWQELDSTLQRAYRTGMGKVDAFLWFHGEAGSTANTYQAQWDSLLARLRTRVYFDSTYTMVMAPSQALAISDVYPGGIVSENTIRRLDYDGDPATKYIRPLERKEPNTLSDLFHYTPREHEKIGKCYADQILGWTYRDNPAGRTNIRTTTSITHIMPRQDSIMYLYNLRTNNEGAFQRKFSFAGSTNYTLVENVKPTGSSSEYTIDYHFNSVSTPAATINKAGFRAKLFDVSTAWDESTVDPSGGVMFLNQGGVGNDMIIAKGAGGDLVYNCGNANHSFRYQNSEVLKITSNKVGINVASPTARLHIAAGTATGQTAPIKFTAGTNMTTQEAGAMEWDGTNLFITQTAGPVRKTLSYTTDSIPLSLLKKTSASNGQILKWNGTIWGPANESSTLVIQEDATPLTVRPALNFVGAAATAADDAGNTRTNVTFDDDLNALASNSTNGLWARTGSGTGSARTITGTGTRLTVTNGDGISGNPVLDVPSLARPTGEVVLGNGSDVVSYSNFNVDGNGTLNLSIIGSGGNNVISNFAKSGGVLAANFNHNHLGTSSNCDANLNVGVNINGGDPQTVYTTNLSGSGNTIRTGMDNSDADIYKQQFGTSLTGTAGYQQNTANEIAINATPVSGVKFLVSGVTRLNLGGDATGDIFYRNSSGNVTRLGIGSTGNVLTVASGIPSWAAAPAPSGTAGGDLSGTYPNPTVANIQTFPVSSTTPETNQLLKWTGSQWEPRFGGGSYFVATADGTVANTTTPTTAIGSGSGTLTIPSGFLQTGRTIRIKGGGIVSTPVTGGSFTGRLKIGSATAATFTTTALPASASNNQFDFEITITGRTTGASGQAVCNGVFNYVTAAGVMAHESWNNGGSSFTHNTTISNAIDFTIEWDTADAAKTITTKVFTVEIIN